MLGLAVGVGVYAGRRAAKHPSTNRTQAMQHNNEMRWPADTLDRLGHKRCPIVLIEIAAKIGVVAATYVVRRIASTVILEDGMPAVVGVFGRRTAGLVAPTPIWSAGYKTIKMVIVVWPNHHRDRQAVWLAAVVPTVGTQTVDATAARQ